MSSDIGERAAGESLRGLAVFAVMAGLLLGAALQLQQAVLWPAGVYGALCAVGATGWLLMRRMRALRQMRRGLLPIMLLLGTMGGAGLAGWRAAVYAAGALSPALEGLDLQVVGVVSQMPQRSDGSVRFLFDVESATWAAKGAADPLPRLPTRIALGWYASNTSLWGRAPEGSADIASAPALAPVHAGERWRLVVRLKAPHGALNPHGFDLELRLWEQGVQASGYVRTGARDASPQRLGDTLLHPIERAREAVRDAVFERVADRRQAGVIAALVTGDQNAIERADWDVFRATGVAHLMSISGLHITMFAWLATHIVGSLWRRNRRLSLLWPAQHAGLAGGVLLATLYALFSGWGLPSQRTAWMLATVALLRCTGRRWPWPFVWLCTCALVVTIDPWALVQPGFWLSFVAVAVLFATDSGARESGDEPRRTGLWPSLARMWREQWVITLALTPLSVLLFQQVSLIGLLANAVAIPWVTLVVTPLAMLGVALAPLWDLAAWAVQALGVLLRWLAQWPLATIAAPAPPLWMAVAGVGGGLLVAMTLPWSMRVLGLPLLLPALLWQPPRPVAGEFDLLAADVGQGNAILVRTANHSLLYDTGPRYSLESDAGHRVLVPLLRALGERLDTVLLSHRDIDHTGGAPAVLAMQPEAALRSSIEAAHPLQQLRAADRCVAGQRWRWDGVDFEILHPREEDYSATTRSNALSCVLRIGNGRAAALLAGDIERAQEASLAARTAHLRVDLLLVPHHGSKTSSSAVLLDAARPTVAVVQSGYRNRFGHPAGEVLARYAERGIVVVDSPHCGAATWSSTAPGVIDCERQRARRYWHHNLR